VNRCQFTPVQAGNISLTPENKNPDKHLSNKGITLGRHRNLSLFHRLRSATQSAADGGTTKIVDRDPVIAKVAAKL
jgi:hypothetical protein